MGRGAIAGLAFACGLAAANAAYAGAGIAVDQTTIVFPQGADARALSISNPGTVPTRVQVRLFSWHDDGTRDAYGPAPDVGFSPAIFALEPGASQVLRLVLIGPRGDRETPYRLFIDQLPPPPQANAVALPIRFVVPVFVHGTHQAANANLTWKAVASSGHVTLTAINAGDTHARVSDLAYGEAGARHDVAAGLAGYVLAGEQHVWRFLFHGSRLTIAARTEQGNIEETVPLTAE